MDLAKFNPLDIKATPEELAALTRKDVEAIVKNYGKEFAAKTYLRADYVTSQGQAMKSRKFTFTTLAFTMRSGHAVTNIRKDDNTPVKGVQVIGEVKNDLDSPVELKPIEKEEPKVEEECCGDLENCTKDECPEELDIIPLEELEEENLRIMYKERFGRKAHKNATRKTLIKKLQKTQ